MDNGIHIASGRSVNAAGGLIQDDQLGIGGKGPSDYDFLLVSSGKASGCLVLARDLDAEIIDVALGNFFFRFPVQEKPAHLLIP